jgi:hypothetical protein
MRPIDADMLLIDENVAYTKSINKCDELTRKINYVVHTKLQKIVMDTPTIPVVATAYDVDEAVKKLEEHFNATDNKDMRLAYQHAISIVKKLNRESN